METNTVDTHPQSALGLTANNYLLDATKRLITFSDLTSLPPLFTHAGTPTDVHCLGLDPDFDGYNPTPVQWVRIHDDDAALTQVIGVRVERRQEPYRAETRFYHYNQSGQPLDEVKGAPRLPWEDPHMVVLRDGRIVVYGVRTEWEDDHSMNLLGFYTEFYIGTCLQSLAYLGQSPYGHKDSRLIVCQDGSLGLYTRPQRQPGEGKIAYTPLESIYKLAGNATAVYAQARLVGKGIFGDGMWGGPNHPVDLGNGWHMVKCHAATNLLDGSGQPSPNMIYSGFMMFHHPATGKVLVARPHANADEFPHSEDYKWQKVQQVVFPGGLYDLEVRNDTGKLAAKAVYGLRDAAMVTQQVESLVPVAQLLPA